MAVTTGMAMLGAAALGTAANIYSSSRASSASAKAAAAQSAGLTRSAEITSEAQKESMEMQLKYLRETRADIAKAVDEGLIDLETGYGLAVDSIQAGYPISVEQLETGYGKAIEGLHRGSRISTYDLETGYGEAAESLQEKYGDTIGDLETGYGEAIEQLQPLTGLEEYNAARQLLRDPNAIMERPSTQFQFGQGVEALQSAYSRTSGGGASGQSMKAAVEYGQNFASMALDAELNRLFPFANTAIEARGNIANLQQGLGTARANVTQNLGTNLANLYQGLGTGKAGISQNEWTNVANLLQGLGTAKAGLTQDMGLNIANLYQGLGTSQANLRVGGASGSANVTGQMVPSMAQGIMTQGQNMGNMAIAQGRVGGANMINQANIQTGLYSNMANTMTDMAHLYAYNPGLFSGGMNTAAQQGIPNTITMW
jgi:hypothetical protein